VTVTPEDVVARYQTLYGTLREATVTRMVALWGSLGGLSDEESARFVARAVPVISGAQMATAALVAAFIATLTRLETGEATTAAAIVRADVTTEALRGVAADEVYHRPIVAARVAISEGKSFLEAMSAGQQRVAQLAGTDVALAQREATVQAIGADERIFGYRRVLTGKSCAFCATASTQRYHRKQLMPLHSFCDCGVAPIFASSDPGQVINRPLLRDLKTAAKQDGQKDYWAARHVTVDEDGTVNLPKIAVRKHGELGPVLTHAGDRFTGPADLAA
jgi:hypothetical protein